MVARARNINPTDLKLNLSTSKEKSPCTLYTKRKITSIYCEGTSQKLKPEQIGESEMPNPRAILVFSN